MSAAVRDIILKTQRIYLDMQSHVVVDHYHVIQCFKCQGVGHKSDSKFCPLYNSNRSICLYCSKEHKSKTCTSKVDKALHECANCKSSKVLDIKLQAKGHTSTSKQCPIIKREINRIANITDLFSKN